jgi:hypothetical protein
MSNTKIINILTTCLHYLFLQDKVVFLVAIVDIKGTQLSHNTRILKWLEQITEESHWTVELSVKNRSKTIKMAGR